MPKLKEPEALKMVRKLWNPTGLVRQKGDVYHAGYRVFGNFRIVASGKSWEEVIKNLPKHKCEHVLRVAFPPAN